MSTVGGLTLSRKLIRGAANARQLEDAFHSGLPVEGKVESEVKGGYEVRIAGQRAFCPYSQIDVAARADSAVAHRPGLSVQDHRIQGRRPDARRLAARADRRRTARERGRSAEVDRRRRGADRTRRLRARVRRVRRSRRRHPGPAARLRNGMVARLRPGQIVTARRGDHRQGAARRRGRRRRFRSA